MALYIWNSVFLLFFLSLCRSNEAFGYYTFMKNAAQAPPISYYDYIIIGGGTSGCPLAATLSERFRVLLLERGGSPYGNRNISNMVYFSETLSDNSPTSPAQRFISEDGVINTRARVLGGGSCLNAGFYTHASADDVRSAGWDDELVQASYRWVEKELVFEPAMRQWQSAVRDGLLEAGVRPYNGYTYDHLRGTKVGGTIFDRQGFRHSAADLLRYANPGRLTVLLYATVQKIYFKSINGSKPVGHTVVFKDAFDVKHRAMLRRGAGSEIILAAGALGSPQLLMLSGVGPRDQLQSMGIRMVLEQPMVGQGMSDNAMNAIFVPSPAQVEVSLIQVVGITDFGSYIEGASGSNFASHYARQYRSLRFGMFSPETGELFSVAAQARAAEYVARSFEAMDNLVESPFRGGFILEKIIGPLSTGSLRLRSKNPDDNPSVTFNYFQQSEDLQRCVHGVKMIQSVIESRAFARFRYSFISVEALLNMTVNFPVNLIKKHDNDSKSLEQFCKDTVMTIWHYHGGCQVGRVVDQDYKVNGVDALRVVDGSTLVFSPGTNPQATLMMLGRYMGVKILNERSGTDGPPS